MYSRNIKAVFALIVLMLSSASAMAQTKEYIQAFIDKDCYLTGEQVLVHISVSDEKQQPMGMSKVAYVELCDTKQMHAGCLVQLKDGEGWGAITLPGSMHSGNYQLNAYTRYQRNFGPDCYYKRLVSVVNLLNPSADDDIEFIENPKAAESETKTMLTDKAQYSTREKVTINVPQLDGYAKTITVSRKDVRSSGVEAKKTPVSFNSFESLKYIPEIDGHIVTAKATSNGNLANSTLSLVGKSAKVFDGQIQDDATVHYYTMGLNGSLPTCINGYTSTEDPIHMEYVLPYEMILPESLPALKVYYNEKDLKDRSISSQIEKSKRDISLGDVIDHETTFMGVSPDYYYDLDEYTKFRTVREILIEFVAGIRPRTINKQKMLYTFDNDAHEYSKWAAVVLLDGMPVYDIDALMEYDARRLKYVQIYFGRFFFGERRCQGVISFISRKGSLQDFALDEGTQMYTYDFPQDHPVFLSPIYDDKSSRQPDFRHTLYFNPEVTGNCEFYTSDLTGNYEVAIKYVDNNNTEHKITSEFTVK